MTPLLPWISSYLTCGMVVCRRDMTALHAMTPGTLSYPQSIHDAADAMHLISSQLT